MARYLGSITKRARNLGGPMDGYPKTENLKRPYPSGIHGQARKKLSEFALQLKEKQRIKWTYGLLERQFRTYYTHAVHKEGVTGTVLLQFLERRLDNVLYRSGLAQSRPQSRQLITHAHVRVNGKKVNIPSFQLKVGDVITVRDRSKTLFASLQEGRNPVVPEWLDVDAKALQVTVVRIPEREEMDQSFNEQLVIEFYSR